MLETGLDDLVQRGAKRRQRILGAGLAASLALSGVMGFTALQAVEARNEAERARGDAEGLVEYMIKDLKFKLEPVGRLDLLEGIGGKAVEYYDAQDIKTLPDDSLTRQAAARQVLAQVHLDAGRMEEAQKEIEASAALTREVLERNPDDTDAIFAHAQSEFWVGKYYIKQGKLTEAEMPYREYDRLAQILYQKDPANFDWVMEAAWGKNNLGAWARKWASLELAPMASDNYSQAIEYFEKAIALRPTSKLAQTELADTMAGKANIFLAFETAEIARDYYLNYLKFLKTLSSEYPNDVMLQSDLFVAKTDYYNGYFLSLNSSNKIALSEALDDFFSLTQYDDENLKYVDFFLRATFNTFENFNLKEIIIRKGQVEDILKTLPQESVLYHTYYRSMARVMDIKINYLKGERHVAKDKLRELSVLYSDADSYLPDDWKLLYRIFLRYQELEDKENTKKFARLFLNEVNLASDLEYPTIIFSKLTATLALQDCTSAKPLAQKLEARGYLKRTDLSLKPCNS